MTISCAIEVDERIISGSSVLFTFSFTDLDTEDDITPDSIKWSLFDESGSIINSRSDVSIDPAQEINIILGEDDTTVINTQRYYLQLEIDYTSLSLGSIKTNEIYAFVICVD